MKRRLTPIVFAALLASSALHADAPAKLPQVWRNAPQLTSADKAPVIAATNAGRRVVAVGDYGVVIFSDDGKSFRQAKVPTRAVLTSVFFINDKRGWIAGHDGTVLSTADGGENWHVLREEQGKDRVLLSIWFADEGHGIAVGQFGLALFTEDGGVTWQERRLVDGEIGEKHLMHIFAGGGQVFVVAEAGALFRSDDGGRSWKGQQTDNRGSFWTGMVMADGGIVVAGMRGHIYRSDDRGATWKEVPSGTQQSFTAIAQRADGSVRLVGNAGTDLYSKNQGRTFEARNHADRANLTAMAMGEKRNVLFTLAGVAAEEK